MKGVTLFLLQYAVLVTPLSIPGYFPLFWNNQDNYPVELPIVAAQSNIQRISENMCFGQMNGILFPDPDNCDSYVQCERGAVIRKQCDYGKFFDLKLFYCVPAYSADCGARRKPFDPAQPPSQTRPSSPNSPDMPPSAELHHSVCRNVRNGITIPNPSNCRAYIECQQNLRLDRECAHGELFEERSGVCLSGFTVDCGDRAIPPSANDPATRNICVGQRNGARISDPQDCRRFFECQNQQGQPRVCNTGDLFDAARGQCIFEGSVNCGARGRSNDVASSVSGDGAISMHICNGMPSGTRISNPLDCQKFFECRSNMRLDLDCPTDQAYDVSINQCREARSVNCGSRRSLSNAQQTNICQGQRNGRMLANPENCRAFIECQANRRIDQTCELGLLFDTQLEACLPANSVRCGTRILPPSGSQSPDDFFPACPRSGVSFRSHPHDCQGYFICAEGNLIQHSCAAGIHFNPDTFQCDFPLNVHCRLSRIVIPQTPLLPDCTTDQNYFPNLVNCKQYYKCVNKDPKLMDCPNGSLWNNQRLRCEKTESEICARSFNAASGSFEYSAPRENEIA